MKVKGFFWISIFLIFCSCSCFADSWILGSQTFNLRQKLNPSSSNQQLGKVLPQLILEQFAENGVRSISSQEELDRKLHAFQTERLSLFLQLSKENKARDALVLSKDNPKELKKSLQEEEKKIREIEQKIDENLKNTRETLQPVQESDEKSSFAFFSKFNSEEKKTGSEGVTLYKNDNAAVFEPSANARQEGINSFLYNKEVTDAKINGLLTGDISVYGEYCSVTVSLYVFPGAKCAGTVTEVGNVNDLITIAQAITRVLTPKVANSKPVKLLFEIEPEEAAPAAQITVDGVLFNISKEQNGILVDAGIHTVTVNSDGYENQTINYAFSGEESYTIKTILKPESSGVAQLALKKSLKGNFYFNGSSTIPVDQENSEGSVSVNGRTILGVFTDEQGQSAFIMIPQKYSFDGTDLVVNAKPFDRAKNIDKRRRSMYTAYSVLICSLVPTFYCTGNYNSYVNAYNSNRGTYEDAIKWRNYTYISGGISLTAGGWFIVEMIRYLHAANQVLPETAKEK